MAGPNTTGLPQTDDYNLGRGIVYFAPLLASGLPGAWRDMGNAPEFNISIEVETLEHQSSREGLKVTDKEVTISQKLNLALTLDEVNDENMRLIFSGSAASPTNAAVAGFTEHSLGPVEKGRWYDLRNSSGLRAYDVTAANVTVKSDSTTLVLNTDYTVDEEMGRVFILSTSTAADEQDDLMVTLTAKAGAKGIDSVQALTQTNVIGALKFISANPANNDRRSEYTFHKVSLKADGDFALIGDDWTQMNYTAVAERNEQASPTSPTMTKTTVRTAAEGS